MGSPERCAVVPKAPLSNRPQPGSVQSSGHAIDHIERVFSVADGSPAAADDDKIVASWRRSVNAHGVDPASGEAPRVLTSSELASLREPLVDLVEEARDELDHLDSIVRPARYTVLLCNSRGIAVDHRGDETEAERFRHWGIWLGGVWSEEVEGTNGIGTCIVEKRPINVHRSQHFRARHIGLSCSAAPVFGDSGELAAVLDVSSFDPELSEQSHALTGALVQASARAIEERWFRSRHRREWVVAVAPPGTSTSPMLFAVDGDQRIVGADRNGRTWLLHVNETIRESESLWSLFEPASFLFRHKDRGDIAGPLFPAGAREPWAALVTPPTGSASAFGHPLLTWCRSRPRLDFIRGHREWAAPVRVRRGLPARALRRVKEYIEANLEKTLDVAMLADAAGYSTFHFARAFKESEGMTPHNYLIARRIERARALLAKTDQPVSEIARASGFSDQSHLARHFRQRLGMSPSMARRLKT